MNNKIDPILLEVLRNAFNSISDEMEASLVRTAYSTNIKDRRDCACGIYTPDGEVITQSEVATPVHLGTMPPVVEAVLRKFPKESFKSGDAVVMNTPYPFGPGHLNDIAVVAPVFYKDKLIVFVANQAHHVDVGGYAPGSMPFGVSEIYQEGLQIPPVKVQKNGVISQDIIELITENVRTKKESRGDLMAQLSSLKVGQRRFLELIEKYNVSIIRQYIYEILNYAERRVIAGIKKIPPGKYEFTDYVEGDGFTDDLIKIHVVIKVSGERIKFDFNGSNKQVRGPLNCRWPSVSACVQYVIKCILDPDLPTSAGTFRPIDIIIPEGSFLQCCFPAAVCMSNIITTQRIVDALLGALAKAVPERVQAASSGTMNILNIGGIDPSTRSYYTLVETYGGGQGAMHSNDGTDGIQNHMTNTRNAPVEVIENAYPLRVIKYGLVPNSEGAGEYRGGMGITRKMLFLGSEAKLTLGSDREKISPWGLFGGSNSSPFKCLIYTEDNQCKHLNSKTTLSIKQGDVIELITPGGGGWGNPFERDPEKVKQDVREGLISLLRAKDIYGVVLSPINYEIDFEATKLLRSKKKNKS